MSTSIKAISSPPIPEHAAASLPNIRPARKWWLIWLNALPNFFVFSALAAIMYLGHHTGWKMPKVSELMGHPAVQLEDWCSEHLVPESKCIECQVGLLPKGKPFGFCPEHGVAECVIHHPELAQLTGEPQLPKYDTVKSIAVLARPENNSRNTLHTRRVQFTSIESVAKSGVDVDVVQERPMTDSIVANGEVMFNSTRVAHLSTRVPGTAALVFKSVGDEVQPGEILALVDAAQVGNLKTQLLQAIVQLQLKVKTVERLRGLSNTGGVPHKTFVEAEAALQEAEIAFVSARQALANLGFEVPADLDSQEPKQVAEDLRFLGIAKTQIALLPAGTKTANLIPIRTIYGGMVVAADVVAGEVVDNSKTLFTVADPHQMRLLLNLRQEDAKHVTPGLPVEFKTDDGSAQTTGKVSWISPAVDAHTRTLEVRVTLDNPDGKLRDKTFGTGRIILREEPHAVVVPRESVQSSNDANFVFVRDKNYFDEAAPKVFHVRQVRLGAQDGKYVELLAGVLPGEVIATKGSPVLLAQLLRSNLGAGCGCHEH